MSSLCFLQLDGNIISSNKGNSEICIGMFQIFTNADQAHAVQVLSRLGLEDCFEGIICFETLNRPPTEPAENMDELNGDALLAGDEQDPSLDTQDMEDNSISYKPRILCKPSLESIEAAIRIANVDPKKTVNIIYPQLINIRKIIKRKIILSSHLQIFFDDSARNIASGKAAGLHTVIVRLRFCSVT